jgi:hypothetical protein
MHVARVGIAPAKRAKAGSAHRQSASWRSLELRGSPELRPALGRLLGPRGLRPPRPSSLDMASHSPICAHARHSAFSSLHSSAEALPRPEESSSSGSHRTQWPMPTRRGRAARRSRCGGGERVSHKTRVLQRDGHLTSGAGETPADTVRGLNLPERTPQLPTPVDEFASEFPNGQRLDSSELGMNERFQMISTSGNLCTQHRYACWCSVPTVSLLPFARLRTLDWTLVL